MDAGIADFINAVNNLPKSTQIIIIILFLMLVIACFVFWFLNRKSEKRERGN